MEDNAAFPAAEVAPAPRRRRPSDRQAPRIVLTVSAASHRGLWVALVLLHVCCATHLALSAYVYWFLDQPYLQYYANMIAPADARQFKAASLAFAVLSVVQTALLLEMLLLSVFSQRLVLSLDSLDTGTRRRLQERLPRCRWLSAVAPDAGGPSVNLLVASRAPSLLPPHTQLLPRLRSWWSAFFGRRGLFGVESDVFDLLFATREGVEVAFQTLQAYRSSGRIASARLNSIFLALVAVNCWSTPVLQQVFRRSPAVARVSCIAVDLLLNAATNMAIPVVIFRPYLAAFQPSQLCFDLSLFYDDVWFASLVTECQLLFSTSTLDLLSKLVPHISIALCIQGIKAIIQRERQHDGEREQPKPKSLVPRVSFGERISFARFHSSRVRPSTRPSLSDRLVALKPRPEQLRMNGPKAKLVHALFLVWGLALLAVHLIAGQPSGLELSGCRQTVRPWFVAKHACVVYEHNCYREPSVSVAAALDRLDTDTLLALIVTHCDALVVPREVQRFPRLLGVEHFNVTLRDWSHALSRSRTRTWCTSCSCGSERSTFQKRS
ncbi:hypothetical protein PINS_up016538 [Pythium insidiosum]|nr:hypothetical protein PINS_up016538 [Pythium insidiosum]